MGDPPPSTPREAPAEAGSASAPGGGDEPRSSATAWPDGATDARPSAVFAGGSSAVEVGGELGGYRILRELGRGGMGAVFEAEDPRLGRRVALKVMLPDLAREPRMKERFLREARSAAAVEHEHVVPIYQVGEDREVPFLVMRLLAGESLSARLHREGPLPAGAVAELGRQAALGLAAAHEKEVTHRDVKPGNLWVEPDGRVRVLDFGLARSADAAEELTRSGCAVGTPEYMAPEQVRGLKAGPKADLFALGAVLYRAATGVSPFRRESVYGSMRAVERHSPPDPRELRPDLPASLAEAILALLRKKPSERPPSAAAVAEVFAAMAGSIGGSLAAGGGAPESAASLPAAPSLPAPGPSAARPKRSGASRAVRGRAGRGAGRRGSGRRARRWVWGVVAVVAVAVSGTAVAFLMRGGVRGGASAGRAVDPLPAGSRWEGTFEFPYLQGDASLRVEGRDGAAFTGVYESEKDGEAWVYAWKVRGTTEAGRVRWEFVEAVRDNEPGDVVGETVVEGTVHGDEIDAEWVQGDERARIALRRVPAARGGGEPSRGS